MCFFYYALFWFHSSREVLLNRLCTPHVIAISSQQKRVKTRVLLPFDAASGRFQQGLESWEEQRTESHGAAEDDEDAMWSPRRAFRHDSLLHRYGHRACSEKSQQGSHRCDKDVSSRLFRFRVPKYNSYWFLSVVRGQALYSARRSRLYAWHGIPRLRALR